MTQAANSACRRNCWLLAAVTGVAVAAFLRFAGHQDIIAALFLGALVLVLFGAFLGWAFCADRPAESAAVAPAPATSFAADAAAARERAARDEAARDQAAREQAARDQAARDEAAREQAARDEAAREAAAREAAAREAAAPQPAAEPLAMRSPFAGGTATITADAPAPAPARKPRAKAADPAKSAAPAAAAPAAAPARKPRAAKAPAPKPAEEEPRASALDMAVMKSKTATAAAAPEMLAAPRNGRADDLKELRGVGPVLERLLNQLGFWHFDQIAAWKARDIAYVDERLVGFHGRITRDEWVAQAKILAAGGTTEHARKVRRGEVGA